MSFWCGALDGLLMFLQSCPRRMLDVEEEGDLPSRSQLPCLSNVRRRPILAPCRDAAVASSLPGPVYCVLWRCDAGAECLCDEVGSIRWTLGQSAGGCSLWTGRIHRRVSMDGGDDAS